MPLSILNLQCCGIKELAGLSSYDSATDAMRQFGELTHRRMSQYPGLNPPWPEPFVAFRYIVFTQERLSN